MTADDVETGIGPVFALADLRVRWMFMGFDAWDSKLRDDEEPIEGAACDNVESRHGEEGEEFFKRGFH